MLLGVFVMALATAADAMMLPIRFLLGEATFNFLNGVLP